MASQAEIIISFLFKRAGKEEISYSDIYLTLSMELNWFKPKDAKNFVDSALNYDLLKKKGDFLIPSFDFSKVQIPIGFSPSGKIFNDKKEKTVTLEEILNEISEKTKKDKKELLNQIKKIESEKNITKEVAGLLVCKEYNIDFKRYLSEIEKNIK